MTKLSDRLRANVECAPWVVSEVVELEAELAALKSGDVVLVPREPTKTMIDTCLEEHGFYCWDAWETLINAALGKQE